MSNTPSFQLNRLISPNHFSGSRYTEVRAQENRMLRIALLNGASVANVSQTERGVSARSLDRGCWGFASLPDLDSAAIERVIRQAESNANALSKRMGREHPFAKIQGAQGSQDESTKKAKLTTGELQERLKNWDAVIQKKYPEVKNRSLTLRQQNFIKEGLNSEGASTAMHFARSHVYIQLGMDSSSGPVAMMDVLGGMGEIEDTWFSDELFLERIEEQIRHLKNKANGIRPEAGRHTVILASDLAGILAHEAVGHTTEADLVKGGSVAREALGKVVASPLVSLVDFAHTALGKKVPAPVYFDDEGVTAKDTTIIDQGVLKSWMHNKETAAEFGVEATGHARAWAFNDEPLIRMRNTAILPGQSRLQDMIASIDDGYFLMNSGNGQADSTSEFMFAVTMGYEIKKGKLGRALLDTTVSGVAFDMLKTVSMVSTEFEWEDAGTCGKKQPMFVGMGGPAIKCEIALGGQ